MLPYNVTPYPAAVPTELAWNIVWRRTLTLPFSEEDIEDEVLHNWLDHFGMHFHQLHASGHLNKDQIGSLIRETKPKKVFPVHTENAYLFKNISDGVQLIEYGKEYKMAPK